MDEKGTINMYKAFIQPYLTYGLEIWGHSINSATDILVKLQSKVLHVIFDYKRSEDAWNHNDQRITPLDKLYENVIKKMCIKHHFNLLPISFSDNLMPKLNIDQLQRRISRTSLNKMYDYHLARGENITSFKDSCVRYWNNQPLEIKSAPYSAGSSYVYHMLSKLDTGRKFKR